MQPVITGIKKRVNKYTFIKIRVVGRHQRQSVCGESESVSTDADGFCNSQNSNKI